MPAFALTPTQLKTLKWLAQRSIELLPPAGAYLLSRLDDHPTIPGPVTWTRWHVRWTRATPAGLSEDKGEFKLDLLNITSGDVDSTWTSADLTACHNAIYAMRTALLGVVSNTQTFVEDVAYFMSYNDAMDPKHPFNPTGPPAFASGISAQVGTGTTVQAYQVAGSVTFKTAFPRHWGRAYLPTPPISALDTNGRFTSSYRSTVATAFRTCFTTLQDAGFYPVIPLTQVAKVPTHGLMGIYELQVDDVPDVVRRRRPKTTGARTLA